MPGPALTLSRPGLRDARHDHHDAAESDRADLAHAIGAHRTLRAFRGRIRLPIPHRAPRLAFRCENSTSGSASRRVGVGTCTVDSKARLDRATSGDFTMERSRRAGMDRSGMGHGEARSRQDSLPLRNSAAPTATGAHLVDRAAIHSAFGCRAASPMPFLSTAIPAISRQRSVTPDPSPDVRGPRQFALSARSNRHAIRTDPGHPQFGPRSPDRRIRRRLGS